MYRGIPNLLFSAFKDNGFSLQMDSHKDVISKLKFISKIQEGEKINVRHMYVQQDGLATKISRTFYNLDNRGNTFNFMDNTIKRSFEIISLYKNSEKIIERQICFNIIKDIDRAREGIINITKTYIEDTMFISRMEALLEDTEAQLIDLKTQFSKEDFEASYSPITPPLYGRDNVDVDIGNLPLLS
jgi:hypothetical protein